MPLNLDELKTLNEAQPFHPFEIVLDDGRTVLIKEQFHVGWTVRGRSLAFDDNGVADWVDFSRVKQVRPVQPKGRSRRTAGKGRAK
jgi:hypothetical protein